MAMTNGGPERAALTERRIIIVVLPGAFTLDVLGPFEIFVGAARLLAERAGPGPSDPVTRSRFATVDLCYDVQLAGIAAGPVETLSGTPLHATVSLSDILEPFDTLIIAGGDGPAMLHAMQDEPEVVTEIRRLAGLATRVASVCTGSFVLAIAGLLNGKRATTHWAACDQLEAGFPAVQVERGPIYTRDGNTYTSAGATTGMDLALGLLADDHGSALAHEVARWLVLYVRRSSDQSQISTHLMHQEAECPRLRELQMEIVEQPNADHSVSALASRVGMSVRNFSRAFRKEVGATPAAYVEQVRVDTAERKLQLGEASIAEVASAVGFGSIESLRRAFARRRGAPPSAIRAGRI